MSLLLLEMQKKLNMGTNHYIVERDTVNNY
jgi:hypothetical protein